MASFEIGCSHGSVLFDVADLSGETDLCRTVIFSDKAVTVYPDDAVKPPRGGGLNQPAVIRLTGAHAVDKATNSPITDARDPRVLKKIVRLRNIKDTEFIDYVPSSGTWTFRVAHF